MPTMDKEADVEALRKEVKELRDMVEKSAGAAKVKKPRKKNPDAKPNPYMEFAKERRAHYAKEGLHKDKAMTEISKIIGKEWQEKKKSSD
uniref:HMG box domain-containing protein n=1 Tax=viral metagenome TaxID=1070528 RepID=A0A6C0F9N2_9ZZZZ|tara:strand:+ start:896 stop:1165 length:270 start_codon:yes stop_codon:yes gene_type:complete